jgi:hypothetical protein
MAVNKNFQDEEKRAAAKQTHTSWACPRCGKTVHISRKYCNCHAKLGGNSVTVSEKLPEIGPCNFETDDLNCNDCPENCMYCASFGLPETNKAGFGGKGCQHNMRTARCYCCQAQVKISIKLSSVAFSEIIREAIEKRKADEKANEVKNVCLRAADIIFDEMTEPVTARINRARERAG